MNLDKNLTGLRPSTFLLAALSLSIGWGIRGNFGHEYGAMIPGALTAIAVCLCSGRADWRERVAYFGMFGALGWGFGGSISYMMVIGYTHSGDLSSQIYGFVCLFIIGFLWGGMGGAGTAFPAVADKDRMTEVIKPLAWIIFAWVLHWAFETWLESWFTSADKTWDRHTYPLYWMDADWFAAAVVLVTMGLFAMYQDAVYGLIAVVVVAVAAVYYEFYPLWVIGGAIVLFLAGHRTLRGPLMLLYLAVGALIGSGIHAVCDLTHLSKVITYLFVWPQAHLPTLAAQAEKGGPKLEDLSANYIYNWPNFMVDHPHWIGTVLGAVLGAIVFFRTKVKFPREATLFVYMAAGWLIAFIAMPVLLGFGGAGLRMTPPRSDDWAGIVGVFLATMVWLRRNQLLPVMYAAVITGIVGGIGFAGAAWLKLMMVSMGNPEIYTDPSTVAAWKHWQSANWHSFLEQSYGFINGLGVALAMGLLARRTGVARPGSVPRPWTEVFAVSWVLFGVGWFNVQKCMPELVGGKMVPESLQAPLFDSLTMSSYYWFFWAFWILAACVIALMFRHQRRYLEVIPESTIGKGQLFYLVFLWFVVVMNVVHALPGFSAGRLLTEWTITFNAVVVTWLILVLPQRQAAAVPDIGLINYSRSFGAVRWGMAGALVLVGVLMPLTLRIRYGDAYTGHAGKGYRFGPEAKWKVSPILKNDKHK